jgi:hypothetical protein
MAELSDEEKMRRILADEEKVRLIMDSRYREEPVHERDCPACDLAAEIAGTFGACWDPNDQWADTTVDDGLPGDSVLDQATRMAAHVLHRRLLGVKPSLAELERRREESRARRNGEVA